MNTIKRFFAIIVIAALCLSGAVLAEEATAAVTAHDFLGEWVNQDGTANIDITAHDDEGNYVVNVQLDGVDSDEYDYLVWAYGCVWNEDTHALVSVSRFAGTGDYATAEEEITDSDLDYADARFTFDDAGMLVWEDANETADDGMLFQHTIGWVDPDYVGPGHHFVGEWNDERMTIVVKETMEDYQVTVTGSGGAFSGAYWAYTCYYDEETDSLISNGEIAKMVEYTYSEDGKEYSEKLIYDDGVAMFRLNEDGRLLWYDKKDNAGEGRAFERAAAEEAEELDEGFYMTSITDEIFDRIQGKSFKEDCTLPREDLRYLHVLHVDLDGAVREGEMIVNYHIADDVLDILKHLYEAGYPIEKIRLVDEYDADDELSMEDNNSSSFNFRFISHTTRVSKHGLGLAVDINTLYNPYTKIVDGQRIVEPITGEPYLDRDADFPYKIDHEDLCYKLFIEHGFEWGGDWKDRKDYQHFEIPTSMIEEWYPENE